MFWYTMWASGKQKNFIEEQRNFIEEYAKFTEKCAKFIEATNLGNTINTKRYPFLLNLAYMMSEDNNFLNETKKTIDFLEKYNDI